MGGEGLEALRQSEYNRVRHKAALQWQQRLAVWHAVGWLDHTQYYDTMRAAVQTLFAADDFPTDYSEGDLCYERDDLGKPYVVWDGRVADWARTRGWNNADLHISNTHDGGAHVVVAAYDANLVGLGIDAVYLPRLATQGKDAAYLRRFAARFMSEQEREKFEQASAEDDTPQLRQRVAAHFSLMEAASKACGTGLKIGVGMGRTTSLPKQSLGVLSLEPTVELLFEEEARARLATLGAQRVEAYWSASADFLISVVLLWK